MNPARALKWVLGAGLGLMLAAACSKSLESSPPSPAGAPVLLTGTPVTTGALKVRFQNARIKNQSNRTIYDVRIHMTVKRDTLRWNDTIYDSTSKILIASLDDGLEQDVEMFEISGLAFISAEPVWTYLPPPGAD